MAELDTGRLISETHKIVAESKYLCDRSRCAVKQSQYLRKALASSVSAYRHLRRKRLLAK